MIQDIPSGVLYYAVVFYAPCEAIFMNIIVIRMVIICPLYHLQTRTGSASISIGAFNKKDKNG